jgi:hypothetical protein
MINSMNSNHHRRNPSHNSTQQLSIHEVIPDQAYLLLIDANPSKQSEREHEQQCLHAKASEIQEDEK